MADRSPIEWTHATWNPTTGCDRVSAGCDHCYALDLAVRLKAMGSTKYQRDGDPRTSGPGFGLAVHRASLNVPRQWRAPRMIFVNSMSDLSVWLPGRPSGSCWVFPLVSALLAGWFGCATRVGHGWSGVLFEVAVVDPACEDAEGGEVLECALFWPVGSVLVCGWVADPGEAALGEGPQCSVAVFDRQVGGVAGQSQVCLAGFGPVGEDLVHQLGVEHVASVDLGLGVGVDGLCCCLDGLAVVLARPEGVSGAPDPGMELISRQRRDVGCQVGGPFVPVVEVAEPTRGLCNICPLT